jgi:hypothetical protein
MRSLASTRHSLIRMFIWNSFLIYFDGLRSRLGSVKVTMSIGCNFKAVVTVQIISLDSFDFVIGLDFSC